MGHKLRFCSRNAVNVLVKTPLKTTLASSRLEVAGAITPLCNARFRMLELYEFKSVWRWIQYEETQVENAACLQNLIKHLQLMILIIDHYLRDNVKITNDLLSL